MLRKNDIVELTVVGMSAEGNGVCRYTEEDAGTALTVFVPQTAVGDVIECRIVKVQSRLAYGKVERVITPSPHRVEVDCPVFGKCGGCVYRHVSYEAELSYKWQRVADALQRIGGLSVVPEPIVGCENPDRYRNKGQYPVTAGEHRPLIGLYAARSHRVIEQHDCLLQPPVFKTVLDTVAAWMKQQGIIPYDETTRTGLVRHIYIRKGERSGEVMVCLVCTSGKLPQPQRLVEMLKQSVPQLRSVMVNLNKADTNVILGGQTFCLYGKDHITDTLCGLQFRLSPLSFYQVNTVQAERLYTIARDYAALDQTQVLLDLYCGTGTIGLSMADRVDTLIGVEIVPQAIEDAERNAEANGIANARFFAADAAEAAKRLEQQGVRPDTVILDPPRKGCDEALIDTVVRMAPDRVVYVSCDPATLARDLKRFAERGYATEKVTPVDMFPRTAHVESVAQLIRRNEQ